MTTVNSRPDSKAHARRKELRSLFDCCDLEAYEVSFDCASTASQAQVGQKCAASLELTRHDTKVAQLEEELVQMHRRRFSLKEKVNRSHDKLLRKIPAEIISRIFELYVQQGSAQPLKKLQNMTYPMRTILILSRVSRYWRDLVATTPSLWTTINLRINDNSYDDDQQMQLLRTLLKRSGEVPLSITLAFDCDPRKQFPDLDALSKTIFECAHRLNHLKISVFQWNTNLCNQFIESQNPYNLEKLEYFQFDVRDRSSNLKNFLQQAPHLKRFEISRLHSHSDVDINWSSITRLEIKDIPWNTFLWILHLAPSLVQCELDPSSSDDVPLPVLSCVHLNLQRLKITHSKEIPLTCLDKLVFPSLILLDYQMGGDCSLTLRAFKSMAVESRLTITSLSVRFLDYLFSSVAATVTEIIELLRALPALKHFSWSEYYSRDEEPYILLRRLGAEDQGQFLPQLESLHLAVSYVNDSVFARIADIFDPKGKPGIIPTKCQWPLRHARVLLRETPYEFEPSRLPKKVDEETVLRLIRINKSGINLQFLDIDEVDLFQYLKVTDRH